MYSTNAVLDAAQVIRPYLMDLLAVPMAQSMDRQLATLLTPQKSPANRDQILTLLQQEGATREWLRLYLDEQRPAETILSVLRTYHPLTAKSNKIESPRYVCPVVSCNQDWYRQSIDQEIPHCPIHDVVMVRDSKTHNGTKV